MKMQIAFDTTDLDKALLLAADIEPYADMFEIGSLLLYKYGEHAIKVFKEKFPHKTLVVDSKIIDHGKESAALLVEAGADWITVMAGTAPTIIRNVCMTAGEKNKKVMLDLLDSPSIGQSALEAQSLGVHALIIHRTSHADEQFFFLDKWDMVRGNTQLPVFIACHSTHDVLRDLLTLNPAGIIIGRAILQAESPLEEAQLFYNLISKA